MIKSALSQHWRVLPDCGQPSYLLPSVQIGPQRSDICVTHDDLMGEKYTHIHVPVLSLASYETLVNNFNQQVFWGILWYLLQCCMNIFCFQNTRNQRETLVRSFWEAAWYSRKSINIEVRGVDSNLSSNQGMKKCYPFNMAQQYGFQGDLESKTR